MVTKEGIGEDKIRSKQKQMQQDRHEEQQQQQGRSSLYIPYEDRMSESKRNRVGSDDGFAAPRDMDRSVKKRRP